VVAPFKHLVVFMMENRSFDHVLGFLPGRGREFPQFRTSPKPNSEALSGLLRASQEMNRP
jgi:phospholipase C